MGEPMEAVYFNWLCAKVTSNRTYVHYELMRILYCTEFVWIVPGDKNRVEDGLELRDDFLRESRMKMDPGWFRSPCSVLEMLIAFAKRAEFQTDTSMREWFWIFLNNLRLDEYRSISGGEQHMIEKLLHAFVWRIYDPSGYGGMFPLRDPKHDQREVEIWYQFNEYLEDQGLM